MGKRKKIIIILAVLLSVVMTAGGYFYQQDSDMLASLKGMFTDNEKVLIQEQYQGFVYVPNIYYSSNNGKRSKLIMMDIAIEVKEQSAEVKLKKNSPRIKSELLKMFATDKYKFITDDLLLAFINENVNADLVPLLKKISSENAAPEVHVTRLIIQ